MQFASARIIVRARGRISSMSDSAYRPELINFLREALRDWQEYGSDWRSGIEQYWVCASFSSQAPRQFATGPGEIHSVKIIVASGFCGLPKQFISGTPAVFNFAQTCKLPDGTMPHTPEKKRWWN